MFVITFFFQGLLFLICILITSGGRATEVSCANLHNTTESQGYIGRNSSAGLTYHVVIARYKEKLHHLYWLAKYSHTIYNRGELTADELQFHYNEYGRGYFHFHILNCEQNFGRESFIYFMHIISNYHKLPDVLVFSQAKHIFKTYTNEHFKADVLDLISGRVSFSTENDGFAFFVRSCASAWQPNHIHDLRLKYKDSANILKTGYKNLLHFEVENPRFAGTGCFAVTKEAILRNSREYYISLAKTMLYKSDPIEGHFFERAWPEVFHTKCSEGKDFHCVWNSTVTC